MGQNNRTMGRRLSAHEVEVKRILSDWQSRTIWNGVISWTDDGERDGFMTIETNSYEFVTGIDDAPELVKRIADMMPTFNIESIEIGYTMNARGMATSAKVTVTITETENGHALFITSALRLPNVSMILHD